MITIKESGIFPILSDFLKINVNGGYNVMTHQSSQIQYTQARTKSIIRVLIYKKIR
jgi:hypothetical protein